MNDEVLVVPDTHDLGNLSVGSGSVTDGYFVNMISINQAVVMLSTERHYKEESYINKMPRCS